MRFAAALLMFAVVSVGSVPAAIAAPPGARPADELLESFASPEEQALARQFRLIKPSWNIYGHTLRSWQTEWCFQNVRGAISRAVGKLWRADTRAVPALSQLVAYFQAGCPDTRNTPWPNETAAAFTRLVQKELRRQALAAILDWKRPPPTVPAAQKPDYSTVGKITCASAGVIVGDWLKGQYSGRYAVAGLALIAGGQVVCPGAVSGLLSDLLG
jgi:hypothetical protein